MGGSIHAVTLSRNAVWWMLGLSARRKMVKFVTSCYENIPYPSIKHRRLSQTAASADFPSDRRRRRRSSRCPCRRRCSLCSWCRWQRGGASSLASQSDSPRTSAPHSQKPRTTVPSPPSLPYSPPSTFPASIPPAQGTHRRFGADCTLAHLP